mmetsp:Transcript_17879/g.29586  ORF Transcript_17879/g.29586 Transcript_17879/m.29586 type:complete len:225 (+) Transcript_17879:1423-2097(+)
MGVEYVSILSALYSVGVYYYLEVILLFNLELTRINNGNLALWGSTVGALGLHGLDKFCSLNDFPEDNMLSIEPPSLDCGNEELGSVGVWSRVGHGKVHWSLVLELEVLISKLFSVNRFTPSSIELSEVSSLNHEVRNDPVEDGSLVVKRLSGRASSLLSSTECAEVLGSLWNIRSEQTHDDASLFTTLDLNIEEDLTGNFRVGRDAKDKEGEETEKSREDLHGG